MGKSGTAVPGERGKMRESRRDGTDSHVAHACRSPETYPMPS
jgi:hypothetical protein